MESSSQIVEDGGWFTRQTTCRPRARLFGSLSIIWLAVSVFASMPFWGGWPESFVYLEWLCSLLLIPLPILVVLTIVFLMTEQPRTTVEHRPNPDYDIRKLY
jgi:hypothetical protein